ncbi:MAG: FAD-dependent oxidoreductase [Proteobacteria bacterium]|nr:FAD-dependent oxidoreductase [Pseudomonadota bacterium]
MPALAAATGAESVERKKAKLVVVGGGVGGLIAARSLAQRSNLYDVILVESSPWYMSGFNSNLFLGGLASFEEINHGYDQIALGSALKIVVQRATAIDRKAKAVILADGARISYDRLVLSPGVELRYDGIPGWGKEFEELMPHAWQGSGQISLLKSRLDRVNDGGVILILAPPNPYACPPGPYERASMMARALRATGRTKCKIIILDAKNSFSMQGLFEEAWESRYPGMIEWLDPSIFETIHSVSPRTNSVVTGFETYRNVDLVNVIPPQRAGAIAQSAELVDETGYCPIDQGSMRSKFDAHIYVLGDACRAGEMPKSAYAARSQAKVAVAAIGEDLLGEPHTDGTYQSICWSELDRHDAIKFESRYEPRDGNLALVSSSVSQMNESRDVRQLNEAEKLRWTGTLISEMFSK